MKKLLFFLLASVLFSCKEDRQRKQINELNITIASTKTYNDWLEWKVARQERTLLLTRGMNERLRMAKSTNEALEIVSGTLKEIVFEWETTPNPIPR